jgi:phage terminase small subunit
MPEEAWKAMRCATRQRRSTGGLGPNGGRIGKAIAALADPREQRFVLEYTKTGNGKQSAVVAGYSVRSAHTLASRLLKKVYIREAIERRNAELMADLDFTPQRIVREIAKVAGVNMADFISIDHEGNPHIDMSGAKRRQLAAVGAVEGPIVEEGRVVKAPKIRMHDKLKALDMLAKLARLYPADRAEISGPNGGTIQHTHRIDIESLPDEERQKLRSVLLALKARQIEAETPQEAS